MKIFAHCNGIRIALQGSIYCIWMLVSFWQSGLLRLCFTNSKQLFMMDYPRLTRNLHKLFSLSFLSLLCRLFVLSLLFCLSCFLFMSLCCRLCHVSFLYHCRYFPVFHFNVIVAVVPALFSFHVLLSLLSLVYFFLYAICIPVDVVPVKVTFSLVLFLSSLKNRFQ
jgi:hypothetical protein